MLRKHFDLYCKSLLHFCYCRANNTATAEGTDNAFGRYRDNVASEIANAKDGATVKISRDKNINALPNDIMQALYKKQTVALELSTPSKATSIR